MPVPPASVVAAATRVRNGIGRAERAMAVPFQLVLERLFGLVDCKAMYCAVELGLPDLLHAGPRTSAELAASCGADADAVSRVMRYLVSRGIFGSRRGGRWANNGASDVLRADHPYSWRGWVQFFGSDWNASIFGWLTDRVRGAPSASEAAFGVPFFEYLNRVNPSAGEAFNAAMAIGSRVQSMLFADKIDLSGVRHLCDVGGGTGSVAAHLARTHPRLRATVFDLPALAGAASAVIADVADRVVFAGGDFFESVPPGCDLYTMFAIVHDWDDDESVRILSNIRTAMAPDARVMVVEKPLPDDDRADFAKAADMLMLALSSGGRERSVAEYEALFARAGLRTQRRVVLPSLFNVFIATA
jgi:SAM-dependent methyltransferase